MRFHAELMHIADAVICISCPIHKNPRIIDNAMIPPFKLLISSVSLLPFVTNTLVSRVPHIPCGVSSLLSKFAHVYGFKTFAKRKQSSPHIVTVD